MSDEKPTLKGLTPEEIRAALYPKRLADLKHRSRVFAVIAYGQAAHERAKRKGKG
jgi:hypothetical protein